MSAITYEQAVALYDSGFWHAMSARERAVFQINEDHLCMPWSVFQEAVELTLGRPVFTHEFALNRDGLLRELNGESGPPTVEQIMDMIPAEKRIVLHVSGEG